jgi:hypothetical protein
MCMERTPHVKHGGVWFIIALALWNAIHTNCWSIRPPVARRPNPNSLVRNFRTKCRRTTKRKMMKAGKVFIFPLFTWHVSDSVFALCSACSHLFQLHFCLVWRSKIFVEFFLPFFDCWGTQGSIIELRSWEIVSSYEVSLHELCRNVDVS